MCNKAVLYFHFDVKVIKKQAYDVLTYTDKNSFFAFLSPFTYKTSMMYIEHYIRGHVKQDL